MKRIADLEARMNDEKPDDLDNLEKELSEDEDPIDNEESVTEAPENIKTEDEDDEDEKPTVDRAVARSILRAIKPTIAALPDDQRQKVVDGLRGALIPQKRIIQFSLKCCMQKLQTMAWLTHPILGKPAEK